MKSAAPPEPENTNTGMSDSTASRAACNAEYPPSITMSTTGASARSPDHSRTGGDWKCRSGKWKIREWKYRHETEGECSGGNITTVLQMVPLPHFHPWIFYRAVFSTPAFSAPPRTVRTITEQAQYETEAATQCSDNIPESRWSFGVKHIEKNNENLAANVVRFQFVTTAIIKK